MPDDDLAVRVYPVIVVALVAIPIPRVGIIEQLAGLFLLRRCQTLEPGGDTLCHDFFPLTAAAKQLAPVDDDRTIQTPQEHHQEQVPRYVTGQHEIDRQKDGQRWPNLDFVRYGDRLTLFLFHLFPLNCYCFTLGLGRDTQPHLDLTEAAVEALNDQAHLFRVAFVAANGRSIDQFQTDNIAKLGVVAFEIQVFLHYFFLDQLLMAAASSPLTRSISLVLCGVPPELMAR